jgi:hypothetical protein
MELPKWAKRVWSAVVENAVHYVMAALVGAVGFGIAAYRSLIQVAGPVAGLVPYLVGFATLFAFSAILMGLNQFQQLRERAQRRKAMNRSPEDMERLIREWLYKYKYRIKDDPQPTASFQMQATDDQEMTISVVKPREHPWVFLGLKVSVAEGDDLRRAIDSMGQEFGVTLTIELSQLGIEYRLRQESGRVKEILLQHPVVFDESLTALRFLQHLLLVRRGLNVVNAVMARALGSRATQGAPELPQPPTHGPRVLPPSPESS